MNATKDDLRFERWVAEIERITREVYAAHRDRFLWRGLGEITEGADLPASVIFDVLGLWYANSQAAVVRRQLDRRRISVSLMRLIEDIARHPEVMSRERHRVLWNDPEWDRVANANFDKFSEPDADQIDVAKVLCDVGRLEVIGTLVKRHVDENVAHTALEPATELVTFADLHAAVDEIGYLTTKYTSLLKAEVLWQLEPLIEGDWRAPFRQPWITVEKVWTEPGSPRDPRGVR